MAEPPVRRTHAQLAEPICEYARPQITNQSGSRGPRRIAQPVALTTYRPGADATIAIANDPASPARFREVHAATRSPATGSQNRNAPSTPSSAVVNRKVLCTG